jgi:hypothetical protein
MSTLLDTVLGALRTRLLTVSTLPALRFYQGLVAQPPSNLDAWCADSIQLGSKVPMTLAPAGVSQWWAWTGGLYQVTLHYPNNAGMHVALSVADLVATAFHGSSLTTSGGTRIEIVSVRVAPAAEEPTGVSVPIQIGFRFTQYT